MPNRLVFSADLGATKVAAAAVTRKGKIVARVVELVDRSSKFAAVLQVKRLAMQLAKPQRPAEVFAAGGVAFPGLVRRSGTVWAPNLPGWEHVPLRTRLQRSVGIPFTIESDRNAAAIGETWLGAARGKADAVLLILGTGIGAGIISGGRLVRGAHELSGCAGWLMVTDTYSHEARRVGQLEALTAGPALTRAARQLLQTGATGALRELAPAELTARQVAQAARDGDGEAQSVFDTVGNMLGRGVANIISLFDPEVVIISGGMATSADLFLPRLIATVREYGQPIATRQTKIRVSQLRGDANLLGAARLAWGIVARRESSDGAGGQPEVSAIG